MTYTGRVIYCCPDCGAELHANGGGWWCPVQELGFTAAELIGAGL